jgi:hypothetical protein
MGYAAPIAELCPQKQQAAATTRHEAIIGLDVLFAWPCRCGDAIRRVHPHSKVSNILIWKCRCGQRQGKLTDDEIAALTDFVGRHGWNMAPLFLNEITGACDVR